MKKRLIRSEEKPVPQPKASTAKKTVATRTAAAKSEDKQILDNPPPT